MEDALHDELDSIMGPIGLHFEWRSLTPSRPHNEVSVDLAVVTFKGRCDASGLLPVRSYPGALAGPMSDGNIRPSATWTATGFGASCSGTPVVPFDERQETLRAGVGAGAGPRAVPVPFSPTP